jgi:RNA polymerase sigma-70 factor, ECF subfamily
MVSTGLGWAAPMRGWDGTETRAAGDEYAPVIARLVSGDKEALDVLYVRFATPLLRYLMTLTPDRQLAEEILQDTFVAVWRGAGTFAGRSRVRTWIFGVARRQASNALRKRGLPLHDDYELDLLPTSDADPEETVLGNAGRDALTRQIGRLGPLHREILVLVFFYELSYAETAEVLEVPLGTVKSRLSNAKNMLRQLLRATEVADR